VPRLTIRAETPQDERRIAEVTTQAFGKEREARIVEEIRGSDNYVAELSLVAELDGEIVGHVLLSYVGLTGRERRVLELGPISVAPEYQGTGIGSALVREALRRADDRGEPLVLVLGHADYYPRFGFRPARELGITPPDPTIPDEVFLAIPLRAYDRALNGRVIFPPAFADPD
jgi:putative acetyltransferase